MDLVALRDRVINEQDWRNPAGLRGAAEVFPIGSVLSATSIDVPSVATEFIAKQVKVVPEQFKQYQWRGRTIEYHRAQIRKLHGFRETTVDDAQALSHWLCEQFLQEGLYFRLELNRWYAP